MTKELELFKRWLGTGNIYSGILGGIEVDCDKPHITVYLNDVPHFTRESLKLLLDDPNFIELDLSDIGGDTFVEYTFKIPHQYHAEWKEHVKTNNRDEKA